MGIKGFNKFFEKRCPRAYKNIPVTYLSGTRIAVDVMILAYKCWSRAQKYVMYRMSSSLIDNEIDLDAVRTQFLTQIWNFLKNTFLRYDIIPIMVFDGKSPLEKQSEVGSRVADKKKRLNEIGEYREQLKNQNRGGSYGLGKLQQMYNNCMYLKYEDVLTLKDFLTGIGIPTLQAPNEGEELCSALYKEGYVSAVFSTDTDNLVHGCGFLLTDVSEEKTLDEITNVYQITFKVTILDEILKGIGFTYTQFVDFCIMCGCDYNKRIKGKGPVTAYNLISIKRSLDNADFDITQLNHIRCRELFDTRKINILTPNLSVQILRLNLECIGDPLKNYLEMYQVYHLNSEIIFVYNNFKIPDDKNGNNVIISDDPVVIDLSDEFLSSLNNLKI